MTPRGGKRKGSGRPKVPYQLKKVPINIKLPRWLLAYIKSKPESRAVQIENAICKAHKIRPPRK